MYSRCRKAIVKVIDGEKKIAFNYCSSILNVYIWIFCMKKSLCKSCHVLLFWALWMKIGENILKLDSNIKLLRKKVNSEMFH